MKKTFLKLALMILTVPVLFSGCATIFGRTSYPVSISTDPNAANISITDKKGREIYKGQSPVTVTVKSGAGYFSKAEYQVKISANGYAEQVAPINFKLNGWYFGNILIGGVLGMLFIDPLTGAMWQLDTPAIKATLNKSTASISEPALKIMDIKEVPENMRKYLVRLK